MLSASEKDYIAEILHDEIKYSDNEEDRSYIEDVIVHLVTDEVETDKEIWDIDRY